MRRATAADEKQRWHAHMGKPLGMEAVGVGHCDFARNGVSGQEPHRPTRRAPHAIDFMFAHVNHLAQEGFHHGFAIFRRKQG